MKKRIIAIIIVILIILIGTILAKNIIEKKKIDYKITKIETYQYAKYKENDKFGIIDREGKEIIKAEYNEIEIPNPEKDIFICHIGNQKNKIINSSNQEQLVEYNKIEPIKIKGLASTLCYEKTVLRYEKDGKYGLVDLEGKKITNPEYDAIENLQSTEGKFLVQKDNKYGVINLNGLKLVDTKYDQVATDGYYSEDKGYVEAGFIVSNKTEEGYRYGYIDYKGKERLSTEYNDLERITAENTPYLIAAKNGKYGLYKNGKELIKPEYQAIEYEENGAIIIQKNELYGIAQLNGKIKVEPKYTHLDQNGIYLYAQNEEENTVYDANGNKMDINFNKAVYLTENEIYKISTMLNNNITYYGIENSEGQTLVNTEYKYLEYIFNDKFIAQNEKGKYGVIDSNGKTQIKFEYDLIQKIKDKKVIQLAVNNDETITLYGANLQEVASMPEGRIENNQNYLKVLNQKSSIFLDNEGNKIDENSEIVKKEQESELPNEINGFKIQRISLEDVYYEK